ncbi:aminoglycoside N(3)-acetyltransferase [Kitasatospora phosalacinea]|uniref:Aminoglycoside N(3)-acetyltransferase n=1 Tax=Kitasatospora phosalacinea TaxID=2065 RepID=A0ABW6GM56_9ACTN
MTPDATRGATHHPPPDATRATIAADLAALGVRPGDVLLVHSALSAFDPVVGGAPAVVLALADAVGPTGTVTVPAQSWQLCDPAYLGVEPADRWELIRANLPPYEPGWTPSAAMGAVAEALRTAPGARRSGHPHRSFAALGPHAGRITARHELADPLGEGSPLAELYRLDARVLLLGVGHDKSTALHLAEARSRPVAERRANGAPLLVDGRRRWVAFDEPAVDDHDFPAVGAAFERRPGAARTGRVGGARAVLLPLRPLVDFAANWFREHREQRAHRG